MTPRLEPAAIRRYLQGGFGRQLAVYDRLPSTNDTAKLLARCGAPQGTAVLARGQTAGRGRQGRAFFSPPGAGLYLTVVVRPTAPQLELLTAAAAVAAAAAVEDACGLSVQIKWVNDLYRRGKKLCGILTEAALGPDGAPDYAVVGIGVNLLDAGFPPELAGRATSLAQEGAPCDPNRLAAALLDRLEWVCAQRPEVFLEEYRARSCVLGRRVTVQPGAGGGYEAVARQIDSRARLVVETPDGQLHTLCAGEVRLAGEWG